MTDDKPSRYPPADPEAREFKVFPDMVGRLQRRGDAMVADNASLKKYRGDAEAAGKLLSFGDSARDETLDVAEVVSDEGGELRRRLAWQQRALPRHPLGFLALMRWQLDTRLRFEPPPSTA